MTRLTSQADPYADADSCPNCRGVLTVEHIGDDWRKVCMNGDCHRSEYFEAPPVVLNKNVRARFLDGYLGNKPKDYLQVLIAIDALLDDGQVITLRKQDGEFVAHIKRDGKAMYTTDKDSWIVCVLGVALAWASDGELK